MIHSISFQNFRGFEHLELPEMAPVTLISGRNNAGKTTVLEGLFLFLAHTAPDCFKKINMFRNAPVIPDFDVLWKPLFFQGNCENEILLSVGMDDKKFLLSYSRDDTYAPMLQDFSPKMDTPSLVQNGCTLCFHCSEETAHQEEVGRFIASPDSFIVNMKASIPGNQKFPMPSAQFINPAAYDHVLVTDLFGKLELSGMKGDVLAQLREMDCDFQDILAIPVDGQVLLYARTDTGLLPMRFAGDGMNRLLSIMMSIIVRPNSIILIDEIENGFHYSMYPRLWEAISRTARKSNCQVIATTHSYECIEGAVEGVEHAGMPEDFRYYRLEQVHGKRCAYQYDWDLLRFALEKTMEVR